MGRVSLLHFFSQLLYSAHLLIGGNAFCTSNVHLQIKNSFTAIDVHRMEILSLKEKLHCNNSIVTVKMSQCVRIYFILRANCQSLTSVLVNQMVIINQFLLLLSIFFFFFST